MKSRCRIHSRSGFTLIEMSVSVIIIAVLASVGFMTYTRFLERMRVAEADNVIGSAILSQQRYYVKYLRFTPYWHKLDAIPLPLKTPKADNDYANGLENTVYYPRGGAQKETPNPGFAISFETDADNHWFAVARRVGHGEYSYEIVRPFHETTSVCLPGEGNEKGLAICIDYMGVETAEELSPDPRHND